MDQNIPVNAGEEEVKVFRNTIDECFDYVINTLTEIIDSNHLPDKIMNEAEELGRITQGIAMAIRAEVMVTAASPLFNGNADYKGYTDSRGIEIFNPNKSEQDKKQRWIDAAEACKQAIEFLKAQGHDLYKYTSLSFRTKLSVECCERIKTTSLFRIAKAGRDTINKNKLRKYFIAQNIRLSFGSPGFKRPKLSETGISKRLHMQMFYKVNILLPDHLE